MQDKWQGSTDPLSIISTSRQGQEARRNSAAMDCLLPQLLHQRDECLFFDCEALLEEVCTSLEAGYHSACDSLSPASSNDSDCFSPLGLRQGAGQDTDYPATEHRTLQEKIPLLTVKENRRSSSKYPGKKRQSASEREKLRMRDLTKALHHLRTYLPPWVAPAGQTLTKIEILRFTIRYISHLSEQLGLSEEILSMRTPTSFSLSLTAPRDTVQNLYQALPHAGEEHGAALLSFFPRPPSENPSGLLYPVLSQDCRFQEPQNISHEHF